MAQALSLRCGVCGTQLKSVAEAQLHNETTGHAQFEESTEALLNLTCTDCGKPCRSQTEVDLHTKRTGHSNFVDKTNEATAMNTEAEMKDLGDDMRADAGLPPAAAKASAPADKQDGKDVELVKPEVDTALQEQLEAMGFSANKAVRALHFTGTSSLEQAVAWLVEHGEDADIDTPLLIPKAEIKPKLSPEEARKAAEEKLQQAKEKRQKEEAEMERLREQERIRSGKELQAAKRLEEQTALKRNAEYREREKAEAARAREKIRVKLAEDKRERRRKLGLPEEPTPEELAKEAAAEAEKKRRAEEAKQRMPVKPIGVSEKLRATLVDMKKAAGGDAERPKVAWATMLKLVGNVVKNPSEEKYRRINLANAAIQSRVARLPSSVTFFELLGFQKDADGNGLYLPADKVNIEVLHLAGSELNNASTNPFFGAL